MAIEAVTVVKGKAYPRNDEIIAFFEDRGLYERTTWRAQHLKLEEEVDELKDALLLGDDEQVLNEAGDCYICLLNVLHSCGLTMEQAVNYATNKVVKRKGKVIDGVFVKSEG